MEDKRKIKSQLKRELVELRQQVGELEASKIECDQAKTESDSTIAEWMGTTRRNIQKYKNQLKEVGLLDIRMKGINQSLSVRYFSKNSTDIVMSKS